jgi:large subunit ribosomal protein L23
MTFKPIATEKAIRLIETNNTVMFEFDRRVKKPMIKKEVEEMFNVKVKSVNTTIHNNKKIAYIRLDKKNPAIDIATKLGMI